MQSQHLSEAYPNMISITQVRKDIDSLLTLLDKYPESEASLAYRELAAKILGVRLDDYMTPPTKKKDNLIQDLLRVFGVK